MNWAFEYDLKTNIRLGLGDVYKIGIGWCLQWNITMDDDIGGGGVPEVGLGDNSITIIITI